MPFQWNKLVLALAVAGALQRTVLLTDEELGTDPDPGAPVESAVTVDWIRQNAQPIRSLTAEVYDDLQPLKPVLEARRIVQLGESGHGVAEFNQIKVRLVKFLHEEMGFDVIAFESPLYECYRAESQFNSEPPAVLLRNCLFAVWHTREMVPLFQYIKDSKGSGRPLILAGFDIQQRGLGEQGRPEFLRDAAAKVDPAFAEEIFAIDKEFLRRSAEPSAAFDAFLKAEGARLSAGYTKLVGLLKSSGSGAEAARQTAFSLTRLIEHRLQPNRNLSEVRDESMAENLDFLLQELYPGKKVIVWGHNAHVRYKNEANAAIPIQRMGTWVSQRHRDEVYTIGLYMYRGKAANNGRTIYDVARPKAGSLESILFRAGKKFLFVDLLNRQPGPGTEWMFRQIPTFDWGTNEEILTPRDQYDGILFIDTVHPPRYGTG